MAILSCFRFVIVNQIVKKLLYTKVFYFVIDYQLFIYYYILFSNPTSRANKKREYIIDIILLCYHILSLLYIGFRFFSK